jgi:hypothetical protein
MKNLSKFAALALAAAGSAAFAGPTELGNGVGSYSFDGTKDAAYFVTLAAGTYTFTADVGVAGAMELNDVWLSYGKDKNANGNNDLGLFTGTGGGGFGGTLVLTVDGSKPIYLDVDTMLGKLSGGTFAGTLTVSAVPEPASGALLLAGIGLLGFMGRRRKR